MPNTEKVPRAVVSLSLTEEEYVRAYGLSSRLNGAMRTSRSVGVLIMGLSVLAAVAFRENVALSLILLGLGLIFGSQPMWSVRRKTEREARRSYQDFLALYPAGRVSFFEDEMVVESEALCRRDPYALLEAAEGETGFLILREDGSFLPVKKAALKGSGAGGDMEEFLRTAFARRLRRVRF